MDKIKISFSGHDKFDCKLDWLIKGLSLLSNKDSKNIFEPKNIDYTIEHLGLGINMIKSLKHWLNVFDLFKNNEITNLGYQILKYDRYLETTDVFWILHWNLVKNRESSTLYYLFFNNFFSTTIKFDSLLEQIIDWLNENHYSLSPTTIKNDIDVFKNIYKKLLKETDIILHNDGEYYINLNTNKNLSNKAFLYILLDYLEVFNYKNDSSISLEELQIGNSSLQKMLSMNESEFMNRIYSIDKESNDIVSYSDNGGLRILTFKDYDKSIFLEKIFN